MSRWYCVHVYYYDPDKDGLLLDAVRPLLERVRDRVTAAYPLRHWRRGPHLRLNVRTDPETWATVVRPLIDEVVGGYLRDHPSTTRLDPREAMARHQLLAVREQERGALTPWRPDNTIHEEPFDSRRHVLGSEAAVELLTDFYQDSTPLLFAMLDHVRTGPDDKAALAVHCLLTVAHTSHPIQRSFVSYRAHAEGYLTWAADPAAARDGFEESYQGRRADLIRRVRETIAALDDPQTASPPFVREWADLLARYRARIDPLLASGALALPTTEAPQPPDRLGTIPVPSRPSGELHQLIFSSQRYQREVFAQPDFLRYRVLLNYTYLHLTRIGLIPLDRLRVCHLTANAVEEVYGVRAEDLIRSYLDSDTAPV